MESHRLSREVFSALLESGRMRFLVVVEDLDLNCIPARIEVPKAKQVNREDGSPYQRSLFDVTMEDDLNQFGNKVEPYLDQQARLFFWYRNPAHKDCHVQGVPRRASGELIVTLRGDSQGRTTASTRYSWSTPRAFNLRRRRTPNTSGPSSTSSASTPERPSGPTSCPQCGVGRWVSESSMRTVPGAARRDALRGECVKELGQRNQLMTF